MIKDRGNIKWQGMMLPEHNKEINAWLNKDHFIERPVLDEWDLQEIQYEIEVAFRRQCVTNVKFWEKGKVILYSGIITEINSRTMCISVDSPFGRDNMPMAEVVSVHIAE
jgi:YolD-like protein